MRIPWIACIVVSIIYGGVATGQNTFAKRIVNGSDNAILGLSAVTQTSDGGFLLVGNYKPDPFGAIVNSYVIKLDVTAKTIWRKQIENNSNGSGFGFVVGREAFETSSGTVFLGEETSSKADYDLVQLDLAQDGTTSSSKGLGSTYITEGLPGTLPSTDQVTTATRARDGGFVLVGSSLVTNGQQHAMVAKLNSAGVPVWSKSLDWTLFPDTIEASVVTRTPEGGFVIAGLRRANAPFFEEVIVVKLSATGGIVWKRKLGFKGASELTRLITLEDGSLVLAGIIQSGSFLIRMSAGGSLIWANLYDIYELAAAVATSDGGFAIGGGETGLDIGDFVIKMDANATVQWAHEFTKETNFTPRIDSLIQTSDGGYALSGRVPKVGGTADTFLMKIDSAGQLHQCKTFRSFTISAKRLQVQVSIPRVVVSPLTYVPTTPGLLITAFTKNVAAFCP